MTALFKALQVIIALSLLIFIHELGHFAWARLFRIKVEKFYLFFDLGGKKIASWKWGNTEFGIGWLPLGGYCKIAGMVDESMDMKQLENEPEPWEFRVHPAWQRLLVMFGGVLNNFIFAIILYCVIMGVWGRTIIPNEGSRIYTGELAREMGFRTGDRILSMDGYVPEDFASIQADLINRNVNKVTVMRGADTVDIYMDRALTGRMMNEPAFTLAIPFCIDSVMPESSNRALGKGDRIVGMGGVGMEYMQDVQIYLSEHRNATIDAAVLRGADTLNIPVRADSTGKLGVYVRMPRVDTLRYNGLKAIPAGFNLASETVGSYLNSLKMLVNPRTEAYKSVGSFIAIGQVMPAQWDWHQFTYIIALLSIMLAVMNLIPIPGLDGGHIVFTLFEMITGRKPSDRFLYIMQIIGMALLLLLMMLAFGNDIGRLIK